MVAVLTCRPLLLLALPPLQILAATPLCAPVLGSEKSLEELPVRYFMQKGMDLKLSETFWVVFRILFRVCVPFLVLD